MSIRSILVLVIAYAAAAGAQGGTAVTVNGKGIAQSRIDAMIKQAAAQGRPDTPELRKEVREGAIEQELLYQEALKTGVASDPDVKNQLDQAREVIVIRAMVSRYLKAHPVTDSAIKAEYDRFAAQSGGKEYLARHILVESEDTAKVIIARLKAGEKFEDLAAKYARDGSAASGGVLDWSPATRYVKPFADAMVALGKGKTSETPVKSQFGYHIIRVDDIREAPVPPLDEVREQIRQSLQQKTVADLGERLRKGAKIK